jgi:hypothetical protein
MGTSHSNGRLYEDLIRFVRIARALESSGILNAAKLFWAAAFAQAIRAAGPQGAMASDDLDQEIQAAIGVLKARGAGPAIVDTLERGRRGARGNRPVTLMEIPAVAVCRECGEILLAPLPARCACGARAATFWEIPPVYFLEPLPPEQTIELLATAADELEGITSGLTEEQMARPRRPGQWAIRDVLFHLLVTQNLLAGRANRILDEDNPSLKSVATWAVGDKDALPAGEILVRFRASRQATLARLRPLRLEQWYRTGEHEEFGRVTLLQQATFFARHERYHMPRMEETRRVIEAKTATAVS